MDSVNWREALQSRVTRPWTTEEVWRETEVEGVPEGVSWYGWKGRWWYYFIQEGQAKLGRAALDGQAEVVWSREGTWTSRPSKGRVCHSSGVVIELDAPYQKSSYQYYFQKFSFEPPRKVVGSHLLELREGKLIYRHLPDGEEIVLPGLWLAVMNVEGIPYLLTKSEGKVVIRSPAG